MADALDGPVLIAKGAADTVAARNKKLRKTENKGSPRRCGGQGDILSGVSATAISWALMYAKQVRSASETFGRFCRLKVAVAL